MSRCRLCNEHITEIEFDFEDAFQVEDEFWHAECFAEYFGEVLETA